MLQTPAQLEAAGLQVIDLSDESTYANRRLHSRNGSMQMEGLHRLAIAFVENVNERHCLSKRRPPRPWQWRMTSLTRSLRLTHWRSGGWLH